MTMTICMECNNRVSTAPGFCMLCGSVFGAKTINRQVAPEEKQTVIITLGHGHDEAAVRTGQAILRSLAA